jgi:predicted anti-sigma-YlaC factor YlaD
VSATRGNGPAVDGCGSHREELGAFALQGLAPEDAGRVEEHLSSCPACRTELEELGSAVALLQLADEAPPPAPARLRDQVVAAAARRHTQRRWTAIAAVAATVAALLGGVVGWQIASAPHAEVAIPLQSVEPFEEASGWAMFREEPEGLVVMLELDGLEPLESPGIYEAWMFTTDERTVSIGQLERDREALTVELTAAGSMDDYDGIWITAEPDGRDPAHEGPTVLRAYVPGGR